MTAPAQEAPTPPTKDFRPPLSPTRRRLSGLALLLIIGLVVGLCLANFNKVFKPVEMVTLQTDAVGNQLSKQGDVKVRGIIVGEIRSVESDGEKATVEMAMDPDFLPSIPSDTTAMLIPKTLFGERYVSLALPVGAPKVRPLEAGDVISQDRSKNATETEQVLNNLLPVLTAVQPQKLSDTLGAVAGALNGRGEQLGDTLVQLNQYLEGINPSLPDLTADLRLITPTADIFNQASPDLIGALDNLVTTSRTLVEQRAAFESTFRTVTSASNVTTDFLAANRANIIDLAATARPVLELLARYSSEFPCLLQQLTDLTPDINRVLNPTTGIQIAAELTIDRGKYVPSDAPEYRDTRGPRCYNIVGQGPQYPPGGPFQDGSFAPPASRSTQDAYAANPNLDEESMTGDETGTSGTAAQQGSQGLGGQPNAGLNGANQPTTGQSTSGRLDAANIGTPNSPNSPEERALVTEVTGLQMGVTPDRVPSFAPYLAASTLRGVTADVR